VKFEGADRRLDQRFSDVVVAAVNRPRCHRAAPACRSRAHAPRAAGHLFILLV
jgi:hypothetical protein